MWVQNIWIKNKNECQKMTIYCSLLPDSLSSVLLSKLHPICKLFVGLHSLDFPPCSGWQFDICFEDIPGFSFNHVICFSVAPFLLSHTFSFNTYLGCLLQIIVSLFCQKHHPKGIFLANPNQNEDKIIIIWEPASSLPQGSLCEIFLFLSETSVEGRNVSQIKTVCMGGFHGKLWVWLWI